MHLTLAVNYQSGESKKLVLKDEEESKIKLSKCMKISELRKRISETTGIEPGKQRVLYNGKQLENKDPSGNINYILTYSIDLGSTLCVQERFTINVEAGKETEAEEPKMEEIELEEFTGDGSSTNERPVTEEDPWCDKCRDDTRKKCKYCCCQVCRNKDGDMLLCDECEYCYHLDCLDPPLDKIPKDDWYCPDCKNDEGEVVMPGTQLKKKRKVSEKVIAKRDFGRGNANAGVDKRLDIPMDHIGKIPDVDVGQSWIFRTQVSASGVHRPPVAGIHSKGGKVFSIVSSGGYEDDEETEPDRIVYTGEGGRELKEGNKRTAEQSMDQTFTKGNLGLASACYVKFNAGKTLDKEVDAGDNWQKGQPIRVIRGYNDKTRIGWQRKHGKNKAMPDFYPQPPEGQKQIFRYDGIYKVKRYWMEKGAGGFKVCRFELLRDDPEPGPWTKEGKQAMKDKGIKTIIPNPDNKNSKENDEIVDYKPTAEQMALIEADTETAQKWKQCLDHCKWGKKAFLDQVKDEIAKCPCCQEYMNEPIVVGCPGDHMMCMNCIVRAEMDTLKKDEDEKEEEATEKEAKRKCIYCSLSFVPAETEFKVNKALRDAVNALMPGLLQ